jgi:hypothetical protein
MPEDFHKSIGHVFVLIRQTIDLVTRDQTRQDSLPFNDLLFKNLRFKLLSDNIIIYYDLTNTNHINSEDEPYVVSSFFEMTAFFVVQFIARTGHLLRGGVSFGKFYTNTFDSGLLDSELVFSEAFVKGYELEQLAIHPRVLVDESLADLWKMIPDRMRDDKYFKWLVQRDKDGEMYLDYYECLRIYTEDNKKLFIPKIIEIIKNMLAKKEDDRRVWRKWYWFKEYHNEKIKSFAQSENQDLDELLIN